MVQKTEINIETDIEIKGIIPSTFLDWDGKVVSTIYLPRCNFRCPFCHNWELIETPDKFETVQPNELDRHLRENRDFLDGVCITGGEPTIYKGLVNLIKHIKELGFLVKLDTNGTQTKTLEMLIDNSLIDYIAMDIKAPLNERYFELAGTSLNLEHIKLSIDLIMDSAPDYEFRTTVVPTMLDEGDITIIAEQLAGAKKYVLQQFVPDHSRDEQLRELKPYDRETMQSFQKICEERITKVSLRGVK